MVSSGSGEGLIVSYCEQTIESLVYKQCREFLNWSQDYQLLKKDPAPQS